jgi:PmbA protein
MEKNNIIGISKNAARRIEKKAIKEYEIYSASSVSNEIEIFNSEVESLAYADEKGIGVRVFQDKAVGYAYTNILDDRSIEQCIESAILNAKITSKEEYNSLPQKQDFCYTEYDFDKKALIDESFFEYNVEDKIAIAKDLEVRARKIDKKISAIDTLMYSDGYAHVSILNSHGLEQSYKATSSFIYLNVISKQNEDTSTGDYFWVARSPKGLSIEEVAANAVHRSVSLLGAKKIKSQVLDVILESFVSAQFLGVIASVLTADAVQKNKSLFKNKIGEKIFSLDLDIFDDGTMPGGFASKPFDAEGVPKGKTNVFRSGILKTYLYDTYTARKHGTKSTGNAVRASYKSTPSVGLSNFYLKPSELGLDAMIKSVDKGFFVTDIIGLHSGANPISGDISVGAKGIYIDKGQLANPIKEVTIATDILTFCSKIEKIASDLKFIPSSGFLGSPSILVKDISVSGI